VRNEITLQYIAANRKALLADLRGRQGVLRDYIRSVARHYATGLYLCGRPGTAKTHTVREVLDREIQEIYTYQRGHLTPLGLFELIADHPDEVIVLDDLSSLFRNEVALQILLSALEPPKARDRGRVVKYKRQRHEERTLFRGGIICISNRELHDEELIGAFKSRVHVLNYNPSDAQLGALMLGLAELGWPDDRPTVTSAECKEVADFVITELLRRGAHFDLRLFLDKALPDYQQVKDGEAESDWRDLVAASIEEHLVEVRHGGGDAVSRAERKEEERRVAQEIVSAYATRDERVEAWMQRTGKSERAFYRRLAEIDNR
jgi:hypothetical protein